MSASSVDALGYVAAVLTTSSFFPQALKTLRTRDTSGISLGMYLMFTSGVVVWAGVDLASQNHGPAHGFGVAQPLLQRKHVVNRLADATEQIGQLHEATDIVLTGDLIKVLQSHG